MTEARSGTSGTARGAYAKTAQFRSEVLDAALRIVAEHGFDAATLQLIADEVHRSKAGLLHHFGSREGLMLEILRHREETDGLLFPIEGASFAERTARLVEHNATVPGLIALFTVVSALAAADPDDTPRRRHFTARYANSRAHFTARMTAAQEAGAIRADIAPEVAADLLIATMDGLQTQWLLDPRLDMAERLRALFRMLAP